MFIYSKSFALTLTLYTFTLGGAATAARCTLTPIKHPLTPLNNLFNVSRCI